jgi:hypothetical protein
MLTAVMTVCRIVLVNGEVVLLKITVGYVTQTQMMIVIMIALEIKGVVL